MPRKVMKCICDPKGSGNDGSCSSCYPGKNGPWTEQKGEELGTTTLQQADPEAASDAVKNSNMANPRMVRKVDPRGGSN